jgi:hypothetical protein
MAGGPILPSSIYLGGASGNLSSSVYISSTGTTPAQSAFEGIGVVGSLASASNAILQFNMPESIPTGTMKLRLLAMAPASSGAAFWTTSDGATSALANIANTTLSAEAAQSITWASEVIQENKQALSASVTPNQILTVQIAFGTTTFTLTAVSVWQASIVWE